MIDDSKPKHYIKLRGKIIELTDAEYAARAERIEKIRSECALERAKDERQREKEKPQEKPIDPYTPGLDRLGEYIAAHK